MVKETGKLLHLGRVTVSEYLLFSAVVKSKTDRAGAVDDINDCIKQMSSLPGNDLIKANHIHPCLWRACQRVIKNQKLD